MNLIPNITLDNIKNSDYWELIALVVWNHYREKKYQIESNISFKEEWYGKTNGASSHHNRWNDPNFIKPPFIRTLRSIVIEFKRTDYITNIYINVETGNIYVYGYYTDTEKKALPNYIIRTLDIVNWMLKNNLLKLNNI